MDLFPDIEPSSGFLCQMKEHSNLKFVAIIVKIGLSQLCRNVPRTVQFNTILKGDFDAFKYVYKSI